MTQRDVVGREVRGGSCLRTHAHLRWVHVNVWQNQYSIVKKNKVKIKIKKEKDILYSITALSQFLKIQLNCPYSDFTRLPQYCSLYWFISIPYPVSNCILNLVSFYFARFTCFFVSSVAFVFEEFGLSSKNCSTIWVSPSVFSCWDLS